MPTHYTQVPTCETEGQTLSYPVARTPHRLSVPWSTSSIIAVLSLLLNVVLIIVWLRSSHRGEAVYSPVDVGLEYSPVKFQSFHTKNRSIFDMPPSPEVDAAWEALYNTAAIRLTKKEAAKLPNNTLPIPGESDGYIGALYVFHQLHCLDVIRQTLYASHYNNTFDDSVIRYCLSGLRQSFMCSADTSVIVWQWSDVQQQAVERTDVPHSCRDFTRIQDWVRSRYVNLESLNFTSTSP
ncbi:hypothetical protein BYT27DRAFT_6548441 [Phlegmacium glaucopus]|nr:hypothetical protein BYT27DRAFT_6548441 [Phlegmacium glaucopus]